MNENTDQNIEQQPTTPTPEASGDQGEKLFTQADLDRIIGERLARERAKAEPSSEDAREADLKAREARLSCREYSSHMAGLLSVEPSLTRRISKSSQAECKTESIQRRRYFSVL